MALLDRQPALKAPAKLFIDGAWVKPHGRSSFPIINPSSEQLLYTIAEADEADIDRAIASARRAFDSGPWAQYTPDQRADFLRTIAAGIRRRSDELGDIWSLEVGTVNTVARRISALMADAFDYYASLADSFPFEQPHRPKAGGAGYLVREPVGVVGAIIPWNATLQALTYKVAPALLAGCTVVAKASPESPGPAYLMAEIIEEAGLPPGVFNFVTADREVSERLVRDSRIDKITFTGSSAAGRRVAAICGDRVARCTLELGGKSAAIVLDDCDLERVAASLSASTRLNCGQVCAAITRVIVSQDRHDDLVDALVAQFKGIRVGDPFDPSTDMGPLATKRQMERVLDYISKGRAEGALLAHGGERVTAPGGGYFVAPTIFGRVNNLSAISQEEIFGPVVCVIPVASEAEAVKVANASPFGLNGAVFTADADRAYAVARQIRTGTVGQNGSRTAFDIAFGGFKQSGIGREGGVEGLLPFLESKVVVLDSPRSEAVAG